MDNQSAIEDAYDSGTAKGPAELNENTSLVEALTGLLQAAAEDLRQIPMESFFERQRRISPEVPELEI